MSDPFKTLPSSQLEQINNISKKLVNHPLYYSITTLPDIRTYMEYQVWCVWDFMALIKSIQVHFLSSSILWLPPKDGEVGSYLYELLATEETDSDATGGGHCSHFETYLRAMKQAGANHKSIDIFISELYRGAQLEEALLLASAPEASKDFVTTTLKIANGPIHGVVAAFWLSRERIIPDMFTTLLQNFSSQEGLSIFKWYLERHIYLDTKCHCPISTLIFSRVIGGDENKLEEAANIAIEALSARLNLLDKIYDTLPSRQKQRVML
jgi:hypothetical protein